MNIDDILVSVLIPNFNYEEYVRVAISSVAIQDHKNIELIVVDDGSTDESVVAIEAALSANDGAFRNVRRVYLTQNHGNNYAVNVGMERSRGYATAIVDSDDRLKPEYISRLLELLMANKDDGVGFVYSDSYLIDKGGTPLFRGVVPLIGLSNEFDPELLKDNSYIPGNALMLTKALIEVLPLDTTERLGNKVYRWRQIVDNGYKGLHIPEPLFFYRMHDRNISGIGPKIMEEHNAGTLINPMLSGYWLGK